MLELLKVVRDLEHSVGFLLINENLEWFGLLHAKIFSLAEEPSTSSSSGMHTHSSTLARNSDEGA